MGTPKSRRFLVAIDDSESTSRALSYLGGLLGDREDVELRLLHLLPPLPTELLEHGGSSDWAEEECIEAAQEADQEKWVKKATAAAQPILDAARSALLQHGVPEAVIQTRCLETTPEDDRANMLIREARAMMCETIVVGRNSLPWLRELFHRHVGQKLGGEARGFSVLIIE